METSNHLLEKLFGPSWKVAITGIGESVMTLLTVLAGASYQLGEVSVLIPPKWKETIFTISAISAFILRAIHSTQVKSKNVTGAPGVGQIVAPANQEPRPIQATEPNVNKL